MQYTIPLEEPPLEDPPEELDEPGHPVQMHLAGSIPVQFLFVQSVAVNEQPELDPPDEELDEVHSAGKTVSE